MPAGSTPVLFGDVNDGIGAKEVGGSLQLLESTVVSELAAGKENLPGGAGESLRSVLEAHDLVSVSSWWDGGPAFFGTGSHCSLLDHLFLPSALLYYFRRHVSSQIHSAPQFQVSEELTDRDITWDLDSLTRCGPPARKASVSGKAGRCR